MKPRTDQRRTRVSQVYDLIRRMWPNDPTVEIETAPHEIRVVRQTLTAKETLATGGNYTRLREKLIALAMNPVLPAGGES